MAVLAVVVMALIAGGCAQSNEYSGETPTAASPSSTAKAAAGTAVKTTGPKWYRRGLASADAELAAARAVVPRPASPTVTTPGTPLPVSGLPSKATFVAGLTSLGLTPAIAECMYTNISNAGTGSDAAKLVNLLVASIGKSDGVTALAALQGLDQSSIIRFVVSVAPCIDSSTLLSLLGQGGGGVASAAGAGSLTSLLGGLSTVKLPTVDPSVLNGIVASIGAGLSSSQLASLTATIGAAAKGQFGAIDLSTVDLSKLDLTKLTSDQVVLLFAVLLKGLSPNQQGQLQQLANVNLAKLGISIDPTKLSPDQYGPLVILLLPYFASAINLAAGNQAPAGADPTQLYVPDGLDLSQINPLYFVSRDALIAALGAQGVAATFAGCIYDHLRVLDPRLIGVAFDGSNLAATGQLLLGVLNCIIT